MQEDTYLSHEEKAIIDITKHKCLGVPSKELKLGIDWVS